MEETVLQKIQEFLSHPRIPEVQEFIYDKLKTIPTIEEQLEISCSSKGTETDIEKRLQKEVSEGNIPIYRFTIKNIDELFHKLQASTEKSWKPKYFLVKGIDSLNLTAYAAENSIVQVASQFNGLESCTPTPTPVLYWIYDHTQGPRAALQSIGAAKHREVAQISGKLTDAIFEVLDRCTLPDGKKVLEKYPNLYTNWYLQFHRMEIKYREWFSLFTHLNEGQTHKLSPSEEELLNDIKYLVKYLKKQFKESFFLSQWVKCQATGKIELQVFAAAPNFGGSYILWGGKNPLTSMLYKAAETIIAT